MVSSRIGLVTVSLLRTSLDSAPSLVHITIRGIGIITSVHICCVSVFCTEGVSPLLLSSCSYAGAGVLGFHTPLAVL